MSDTILAAGGLLERDSHDGRRIAVVHRKRYRDREGHVGDWVLPKGKPEGDETLEETALREVEEETGFRARLLDGSFRIEYMAAREPKAVTFYRMEVVDEVGAPDPREIAAVDWLTPAEAIERLTYDSECGVVRDAYDGLG